MKNEEKEQVSTLLDELVREFDSLDYYEAEGEAEFKINIVDKKGNIIGELQTLSLDYPLSSNSYFTLCALDSQIDEELELLIEEIQEKKQGLEYLCPYCDFKADYFHIVTIHMAINMSCSEKHKTSPCYPIQKIKEEES